MKRQHKSQADDDCFGRGMDCFFNGLHYSAISLLSEAAQKDPHDGMIYYVRALAYREIGRMKEARDDFMIAREYGISIMNEFMDSGDGNE